MRKMLVNLNFFFYMNLNLFADQSAEKKMKRYIESSHTVIEYIDELYLSMNIGLDWWLTPVEEVDIRRFCKAVSAS